MLINLGQQVLEREGRTPRKDDLKAYKFPVSPDAFTRRFGGWRKALLRAHDSITLEDANRAAGVPGSILFRVRLAPVSAKFVMPTAARLDKSGGSLLPELFANHPS